MHVIEKLPNPLFTPLAKRGDHKKNKIKYINFTDYELICFKA